MQDIITVLLIFAAVFGILMMPMVLTIITVGIIGMVWLGFNGDWVTILHSIFAGILAYFVFLLPVMFLRFAVQLSASWKILICESALVILWVTITLWGSFVFHSAATNYYSSGNILPYLLCAFAIVTGPTIPEAQEEPTKFILKLFNILGAAWLFLAYQFSLFTPKTAFNIYAVFMGAGFILHSVPITLRLLMKKSSSLVDTGVASKFAPAEPARQDEIALTNDHPQMSWDLDAESREPRNMRRRLNNVDLAVLKDGERVVIDLMDKSNPITGTVKRKGDFIEVRAENGQFASFNPADLKGKRIYNYVKTWAETDAEAMEAEMKKFKIERARLKARLKIDPADEAALIDFEALKKSDHYKAMTPDGRNRFDDELMTAKRAFNKHR